MWAKKLIDNHVSPDGKWGLNAWDDGNEIWFYSPSGFNQDGSFLNALDAQVERVVGKGSKRPHWTIVDRSGGDQESSMGAYPPAIAGPYPTLEAAKAAFLVMYAAGLLPG